MSLVSHHQQLESGECSSEELVLAALSRAEATRDLNLLTGLRSEAAIAEALGSEVERVNVKVTSTDQLGAIGRAEGIAAQAVVLLVAASGAA